ncbi:MAG: GNAT family N-acetyltransferase [Oscillochloris sp.]|nr:GNAT family N-acetyltransferase [Oscillochloris sp.]
MISIQPLTFDHLGPLVAAYAVAPAAYSAYFQPFSFDLPTLQAILAQRVADLYFLVRWADEPAGFFMLRGFDQGYRVPTYGVWIAPPFSRRGLGRETLHHAVRTCRARGCDELMLKVHPLNIRAMRMYERFGFTRAGVDPRNANLIYKLAL